MASGKISKNIETCTISSPISVGYQRIIYPDDSVIRSKGIQNKVLSVVPQSGNTEIQIITTPYNNGFFVYSTQSISSVDFVINYFQ